MSTFRHEVPLTRPFASLIFRDRHGEPWRWNGGRTDLQVIGSYTRTCRRVIDPAVADGAERAARLWETLEQEARSTA